MATVFPNKDTPPVTAAESDAQDDEEIPTSGSAAPITRPATIGHKRKRFNFIERNDISTFHAVRSVDAHIPDRSQSEPLYHEVVKTFFEQVPSIMFKHIHELSRKTLSDRFKRVVAQRSGAVKRTETQS